MKKKHLTYGKKALSVFLSVLMLMTAWVFVPGEHNHAEAIEQTTVASYNLSLVNSLTNLSTSVTTMTGSFAGDTDYISQDNYNQLYKNVLYTKRVTLDDTPAVSWKPTKWKDNNPADRIAYWHPVTTLLYDGSTQPEFGVVLEIDAANSIKIRSMSGYISGGANGLSWKNTYWKGLVTGRQDHTYLMNAGSDYISTDGTEHSGKVFNTDSGQWVFLANSLKFTATMGNTEYLRTITPTYGYIGMQASGDSWHTLTGASAHSIYVLNYVPIKNATNQVNTWLADIKANPSKYSTPSVIAFVDLYNKMAAAHPNNYVSASSNNPSGYNTAATAAMNAYNSFSLVERKYDVTGENIFSFADWYYSTSNGSSAVSMSADVNAGTVYMTAGTTSGEVTTYHSGNPTRDASKYAMVVSPETQYTLEWTASSTQNANYVGSQMFCFFYDQNGNAFSDWASYSSDGSSNGTTKYTFTTPKNAYYMEIRFDLNNNGYASNMTFSNVKVYKTARGNDIDFANWPSGRDTRKVFTYQQALGNKLDVPVRNGYIFNGWYLDNNGNGIKDTGDTTVTDGNGTVDSSLTSFQIAQNYVLSSDWTIKSLDVGYDNLFSLTDLYYSGSATLGGGANGTIDFDLDAGTVTIESVSKNANNECYTSYNADGFTMDVEPETEYIFTADVDFADNSTAMYGQMFIFCYDANGAAVNGPTDLSNGNIGTSQHIGIYPRSEGTSSIRFKTPAGCYKLRVRLGSTDLGVITTYSNIGVYKLADYDAYAKDYVRVREPFVYGDTTSLIVPTREGYNFVGWQRENGDYITSVTDLYDSETVYAVWQKLVKVDFVNYDGTLLETDYVVPGGDATPPATSPTKAPDADYEYVHSGWSGTYTGVTADTTITATYSTKAHTIEYNIVNLPTCETNALVMKYCTSCNYDFGAAFYSTELDSHKAYGHDYSVIVKGSSTGVDGVHTIACANSGCNSTITGAHSFQLDANQSASDATCIKPGETYYICTCNQTKTVYGSTNPNNHVNKELRDAVAAECEKDGYTGDTYCNDCNKIITPGTVIPKLGHSFTTYKYNNDAECEKNGTETATCDRCDATDTREATNTALQHNWTDTEKYLKSASDCTNDAVYYKECSLCGISSESKTGATWTKTGSAIGHLYTNYVYNGDAKCEQDGTKTASCDHNCGTKNTITAEGTALQHDYTGDIRNNNDGTHSYLCKNGCNTYGGTVNCTYGAWTTDNEVTHSHSCNDCGYTPAAVNHSWTAWTSTNADGEEAGEQTRECTVCHRTETKACTYETTHYNKTCTTPERTEYLCSDCGHGYTVIGEPATGHNYTGAYNYDAEADKHQQLCANGCNTYGVGTTANAWEACTWAYTNTGDGTHTASCVCGNSEDQACSGGEATCTAPAVCQFCNTDYGTTTDHNFTGTVKALEGDVHAYLCVYCNTGSIYGVGTTQNKTEACSGGTATCTALAECTVCHGTHGDLDADNHKWGDPVNVDGTETHIYTCEYNGEHTKTEACIIGTSEVVAPTCEEAGYTLNTCSKCAHQWNTAPTIALGHSWGAWVTNNNGTHTKTCEREGCNYGENGAAKTETAFCTKENATAVVTDPTCTEAGYTTYTCNDCGYVWTDDATNATGHTWENTKTFLKSEATCLDDAVYYQECSVCKISAENDTTSTGTTWTDEGSKLGHDFTEEVATEAYLKSEATCTDKAVYYKSCTRCDVSSEGTDGEATFEYGDVLGHNWTDTETYVHTESDCITDAVFYKECSRCNTSSKDITGETWTKLDSKSGHKFETATSHTAYLAPTCTDDGNIEYYTCDLCHKTFTDEGITPVNKLEIAKLGHNWVTVAYKAPTCEEAGHSEYKDCSRCEAVMNRTEYAAKGHNFGGVYTYESVYDYHSKACLNGCGNSGIIDAEGNQIKFEITYNELDEAVIVGAEKCAFDSFEAETDENGIHSHNLTCVCGNITSVAYADADTLVETVAPTCTTDGYDVHECPDENCDATWHKNVITAPGHDWAENATSNGNGTHSVKCANCDATTESAKCSGGKATCKDKAICEVCGGEYGETTDHTLAADGWTSNGNAKCMEDGTKSQACSVCGETVTVTDEDSKLGHDMVDYTYDISGWTNKPDDFDKDIKAPTCGAEGLSISYCSRCDYYRTKNEPKDTTAHVWETDGEGNLVWDAVSGDCSTGVTYKNSCTVCDKTQTKVVTGNHDYRLTYELAPTCTKPGIRHEKCYACGAEKVVTCDEDDALNVLEHNYGEPVQVAANCEEAAHKEQTCTRCGYVEKTDYTGNPKHSYRTNSDDEVIWVEHAGTCETAGYREMFCTKCDYVRVEYTSVPTGHTDGNSDGKCDNCRETLYEAEGSTHGCNCICHKTGGFMKFIYKIINFFWKLFRISNTCACGEVHW